ncbi:hypothetical protein CSV86_013825 [Pseudomonas putida CSV86]|uniref:Uncharacterized protein n=1 Tax=Pseudomonas bharatica CSV86 TaxID=1005395 RepID=L1LRF3_9PSED|nr:MULTISPECIES: hypothetical protein [Pseudomonas]MDG9884156.1 hypothetical protein [Pseudomonas sp. GD04058]NNJ16219.1 hypothetical protein [Pseudomonas bharatica CSV86]
MNKRFVTSLFIALGTCFALHTPSTYAGVSVGGACTKGSVCAAGLVCSNATCQYPGDKIDDDLQRCKDKLITNGMSSGTKASYHNNFCYDSVACPEVSNTLQQLQYEVVVEPRGNISYEEWLKQRDALAAKSAAAKSERDATVIKAASQECNQCTSGGKARCFYPVLY